MARWEPTPARRKQFKKLLEENWAKAEVKEVLLVGSRPVAVLLCFSSAKPMVKGHKHLACRYHPRFRARALGWFAQMAREHRAHFNKNTDMMVPISDAAVYLRVGFEIHSTILRGKVKPALKGLMRVKNPPLTLEGFEIRGMKTGEVPALMRLQKKVFSRIPEKGYYSHTKQRLRADKKEYLEVIRTPKRGKIFGVWQVKKLVGFFGLFVQDPHTAGTGLMFDFPVQGQGLAKTAYRLMLEEAVRRGVRTFHGGTSQPAVLGLAKIMKRKATTHVLRYKSS
ncbi:MAG: GNAT family N-acetyltransferase [Bdellovibrionota bacterium]